MHTILQSSVKNMMDWCFRGKTHFSDMHVDYTFRHLLPDLTVWTQKSALRCNWEFYALNNRQIISEQSSPTNTANFRKYGMIALYDAQFLLALING